MDVNKNDKLKSELKTEILSPATFYKSLRPENFSDSAVESHPSNTREVFAFELSKITTNQKEYQFETLCRRYAEKFISPNLIPQVGPSGGGDGKIDSETHPVSSNISDRWFIPENGWSHEEKWAFAISAKNDWRSKMRSDVSKIVGTDRDYTKIFFLTNQAVPSKKRKEAEEKLSVEFGIECILLDGEWLLEKTFSNQLISLFGEILNLSPLYSEKKHIIGSEDQYRLQRIIELEENIEKPNRYFECDYQLVEDALEAGIIARELERPREEVEGKLLRALRYAKRISHRRQILRVHYQRCWTYMNYYDDVESFLASYCDFKALIDDTSPIGDVEFYVNLVNLIRGIVLSGFSDISQQGLDYNDEVTELYSILESLGANLEMPCSSVTAKTYLSLQRIFELNEDSHELGAIIADLINSIRVGSAMMHYPFESFKEMIELIGERFPSSAEYDDLVEMISLTSERRSSKSASGEIFMRRGGQKLLAGKNYDAIRYLGKAIMKLAKEETQLGMELGLRGLASAYSCVGLHWAAHNCLVSALALSFQGWYSHGAVSGGMVRNLYKLIQNELFVGRIPVLFCWFELFSIMSRQVDWCDTDDTLPASDLIDTCLANRLLNSDMAEDQECELPGIFKALGLTVCYESSLYKLGQLKLLTESSTFTQAISDDIDEPFRLLAIQPFRDQIEYPTNYLVGDKTSLFTNLSGCLIRLKFETKSDCVLIAESILAFLESFFSTTLNDAIPHVKEFEIEICCDASEFSVESVGNVEYGLKESSHGHLLYIIPEAYINASSSDKWSILLRLLARVLSSQFLINKSEEFLKELFEKDEVHERVSVALEHCGFVRSILGEVSNFTFTEWLERFNDRGTYTLLRKDPLRYNSTESSNSPNTAAGSDIESEDVPHNKIKNLSLIDLKKWDAAKWKGFGLECYHDRLILFIHFADIEAGTSIFEDWIGEFGPSDQGNRIRLSIIKGVNRNYPNWYRVHFCSNINTDKDGGYFINTSRTLEMQPDNSKNMDHISEFFETFKEYYLCPAHYEMDGGKINVRYDKSIHKSELIVKDAWQIDERDFDRAVILPDDLPIIPQGVYDAPVLELLKS